MARSPRFATLFTFGSTPQSSIVMHVLLKIEEYFNILMTLLFVYLFDHGLISYIVLCPTPIFCALGQTFAPVKRFSKVGHIAQIVWRRA